MEQKSFLPFILFLAIVVNPPKLSNGHPDNNSPAGPTTTAELELIHRDHLLGDPQTSRLERLRQMLRDDMIRMRTISLSARRDAAGPTRGRRTLQQPSPSPAVTPISSGASLGVGQYLAMLKIGSLKQSFKLVVDTGSDLTWVNCNWRGYKSPAGHVFEADRSSSFKAVNCSSKTCKDLSGISLRNCSSKANNCLYDYRYAIGSAQGIIATETVTFTLANGSSTPLRNTLIGCGQSNRGLGNTIKSGVDGMLGMGNSYNSLPVQAFDLFKGVFSYCLVDYLNTRTSGKLVFGSSTLPRNVQYTKLVLDVVPYYGVQVRRILVNGKPVNVSDGVWNFNLQGGMIIDSGSTFTSLVESAYVPVMAALASPLSRFTRVKLKDFPLEFCYKAQGFVQALVPQLEIVLDGGVIFAPAKTSYAFAASDGAICFGFVSVKGPDLSVIGNRLQQGHLWQFDPANGKLAFACSTCAS